jgi:hypothetical protein
MKGIQLKSKAICILGMHRSGTSTVARAINLLGAYLGEEKDLLPPTQDNPEGYWERKDIYNMQERLLARLKRTWDTVAPLPDKWFLSDEIRPFREELRELIKQNLSGKPLWAWKDPRTCILLPLWRHVLAELGVEVRCVFVVRNPLDVAKSLQKRDNIPLEKAYGIWFNHNIVGLQEAAGLPTIFLSYDKFLEGWAPELRRCAEVFGIDWPADEKPLREAMNSFIRPDLRHSFSKTNDLHAAPALVRDLYLHMLEQTKRSKAPDASFTDIVERLYGEFNTYASFFLADLDRLFEGELKLLECNKQMASYYKGTEPGQQLAGLLQTKAELDRKIAKLDRELAERDRRIVECRHQMRTLLNSRSWKATAPLRWIHSKIFN